MKRGFGTEEHDTRAAWCVLSLAGRSRDKFAAVGAAQVSGAGVPRAAWMAAEGMFPVNAGEQAKELIAGYPRVGECGQ